MTSNEAHKKTATQELKAEAAGEKCQKERRGRRPIER